MCCMTHSVDGPRAIDIQYRFEMNAKRHSNWMITLDHNNTSANTFAARAGPLSALKSHHKYVGEVDRSESKTIKPKSLTKISPKTWKHELMNMRELVDSDGIIIIRIFIFFSV